MPGIPLQQTEVGELLTFFIVSEGQKIIVTENSPRLQLTDYSPYVIDFHALATSFKEQ